MTTTRQCVDKSDACFLKRFEGCGNVAGVAKLNNMMSVDQSAPEATFYTVISGDTLSKIAKTNIELGMPIADVVCAARDEAASIALALPLTHGLR